MAATFRSIPYIICLLRVMQFSLLVSSTILAVALAATQYQRPELHRSRSMVIAHL